MADFGNLVQKAFYLGVGLASYAGEKAGSTFSELREQAQKLVDELVERGEITAEEAQKIVNDMVDKAQATAAESTSSPQEAPRRIEILEDDSGDSAKQQQADALRDQVDALREELRRLKED